MARPLLTRGARWDVAFLARRFRLLTLIGSVAAIAAPGLVPAIARAGSGSYVRPAADLAHPTPSQTVMRTIASSPRPNRLASVPLAPAPVQELHVINVAGIPESYLAGVEWTMQIEAHWLRVVWGTPEIRFGDAGWPVVLAPPPVNSDLSYHNSSPAAYVWTDGETGLVSNGERLPWPTIFSHEILEMLVDPSTHATFSDGFWLEVCDPVLRVTVNIAGVPLQDFVTPNWFGSPSGPWDLAGVLRQAYDRRR